MLNTDRLCMGCMNDNGGEAVCPICGYDSSIKNPEGALAIKTILEDRFMVGKLLFSNGEGLSYIGWDIQTNTVITIKEFFPKKICERINGMVIPSAGSEYLFNNTLLKFTELSNRVANINDLPSLCPVISIFEAGGTAYCITKAASGFTLKEFLIKNGGTLEWEQARSLFLPLISTIKGLHEAGIIHRGISPDTIIVGRDGRLKLTGICIKDVRSSRSELTREIFPGYAAIEQYGFDEEAHDGPHTDVYSLAATLFRVLVGNCPPEATSRITDDNMAIPAKIAESLPKHVLVALANALQIMPGDRTQTIDDFRRDIIQTPKGTRIDISDAAVNAERRNRASNNERHPKKPMSASKKYTIFAIAATALICVAIFILLANTVFKDFFGGSSDIDPTSSTQSVPSKVTVDSSDYYSSEEKTYAVPQLIGKSFADVINDVKYEGTFKFEITGKSYSDKYEKGTIISQSVDAGTNVVKETTISVSISLGSKMVTVPNLKGKTKTEAYIALLEIGFLKDNISFVDKYDDTALSLSVIETEPAASSRVYPDSAITVYINTYDSHADEFQQDQ